MSPDFKLKLNQSKQAKKLMDFLSRESNNKHTEFRIVVRPDGTSYGHVMNRNSETVDFKILPYGPKPTDKRN